MVETFYKEVYGAFDVKNGNVVDVGAFIGDTSIYFASHGAEKVIAFEPAKNLFHLALQNVCLNNFSEVIDFRNEAVGIDYGEEKFYYMRHHPRGSSLLPRRDYICHTVKVVPLSDAIAEIGNVDLLKIDCEGLEDKILL
ncbi:MAG: FkbM family methyltransferase [Candidatus Bathyarchaeia archaeon]